MGRDLRGSVARIFQRLYQYADARGTTILTPSGAYRTVRPGSDADETAFSQAKCVASFRSSMHQAAAIVELHDTQYLARIGFEFDFSHDQLVPQDPFEGLELAFLADVPVWPRAQPSVILDSLSDETSAKSGYIGHEFHVISGLFPPVELSALRGKLDGDQQWQLFLLASMNEAAAGGSWIDESLSQAVGRLVGRNLDALPYSALCRAAFDLDPRSFFMALYRCLEATYARASCIKLASELGLTLDWPEIAGILDSALGWRVRQGQSIGVALEGASADDLRDLVCQLGAPEGESLSASAGKAIYDLRNRIVHYGPGDNPDYGSEYDWNRLCSTMTLIVGDVYHVAFSRGPS